MNTLQEIYKNKLVAVIRGAKLDTIVPVAKALLDGGINILEITAETPGVLSIIEKAATEFGDEVLVGVGTILDPETARVAIMAGAKFVFSPTVNIETIKVVKRYGVVCIPGAMTPTEILTAYENGADIIKVFPANIMGPSYLKDVHGPMPQIPLMPTGGVNLENISDYFANGAVATGLGGSLVNLKGNFTDTDAQNITKRAEQFRQLVKKGF
jgi:2-dehydro-3-deoxyphosphogluconate aldolase/(4S)-4-hydroxy-2-oxoglutarate aldolase